MRRFVLAALLSLMFVDSCTSCAPTFTRDGQTVQLPQVAGWTGVAPLRSIEAPHTPRRGLRWAV